MRESLLLCTDGLRARLREAEVVLDVRKRRWIMNHLYVWFTFSFEKLQIIIEFLDCAAGWNYFPHTQHCYRHFRSKVNWLVARDECRKYGNLGTESLCQYYECATLASIHDEYTNSFLVSLTAHESKESFRLNWIGGIFAHGLEEWTWEDTSPFDYSNFARGEGTAEPAKPEIFLEFNR